MEQQCAAERLLRGGKIIFDDGRSVIDCTVSSLTGQEATLAVDAAIELPRAFDLLINGESKSRPCIVRGQSENVMAVLFWSASLNGSSQSPRPPLHGAMPVPPQRPDRLHGSLASLRSSLDEVDFGVVLLDAELRARFINRAFQRLWGLAADAADTRPAFVELLRACAHRSDTEPGASSVTIEATLARVRSGDSTPAELRLPGGEVLRFQCFALPCGGRMLSYTPVTDIVRRTDELQVLRDAIDSVEQGIVLLNDELVVQFANKKARSFWRLTPEQCEGRLTLVDYIAHVRAAGLYGVPSDALDDYVIKRVTMIKSGDPTPFDIPVVDGRTIRAQCTALSGGGRMLTYTDVTDLIDRAAQQERLATTDVLTGLCNRRQFLKFAEAEWDRFVRYQRPFSVLYVDIDNFKAINDRFGHDAGDRALTEVARVCNREKRAPDVVARIGGDEIVVLLPETDEVPANHLAERLRKGINDAALDVDGMPVALTVSIGVASAAPCMSCLEELLKLADRRLYRAKSRGRNCIAPCEDAC